MASHKIYTYADPFGISETSFWDEIKDCPHLCSSRALVRGLSGLYGRDFVPCICTVEDVLERIYPEWLTNTELHIKQLVLISNTIDQLDINWKMKKALKFNRHDLFKAVRFLQEMNVDYSDLDLGDLTSEQKCFVELYRELLTRYEDCFSMPGNFTMSDFSRALADYMEFEINEKTKAIEKLIESGLEGKEEKRYLEGERRLLEWLEKQADSWRHFSFNNQEVKRVVLHGIHMFTPMRVKLIQELENCGIEVVFLHNYLPDYPSIYKTWNSVYSWVDTAPQRDEKKPVFRPDLYLKRPPLGKAVGDLIEGRFNPHDLSWLEYYEFDNVTSFAMDS